METYIALLRGINLGSHNRIAMPALTASFEQAGFQEVTTYLQSGNVVFKSPETPPTELAQKVQGIILNDFKLEVPVIVRSARELQAIAKHNPYLSNPDIDLAHLHVTFLSTEPSQDLLANIPATMGSDEWICTKTTIYLHCPGGYGTTKLNNTFFERKLKVGATTRNWKTVCALTNISNS